MTVRAEDSSPTPRRHSSTDDDGARQRPQEAHSVDTNGWYGLTFYLGIEVEQVTMRDQVDDNPAYRPVWDRLNRELLEDARETVVYIVEDDDHEEFERELRSRHLTSRVLAYDSKKDFLLYSTPRHNAAASVVPELPAERPRS